MEARQYNYTTTDVHNGNVEAFYRKQKRAYKRAYKKALRNQKIMGAGMLLLTLASFFLEDKTAFVFFLMFFVPMGLYSIFTKKVVL
jgi:hypothetical protein